MYWAGEMFKKMILRMICLLFVAVCADPVAAAGFFVEKPLATIDGQNYTAQDFKQWWKYWRQGSEDPPATPEPFIEWRLLIKEAERLQLFQQPSFKHKMDIFLKARSLLLFKNEEIDAQINGNEDQLWDFYNNEFSPRTFLEILYFKDRQSAEQASEDLESGRFSMQQYQDRSAISGSQISYEEKMVRPRDVDPEWQRVLADTAVGQVSSPLPWQEGCVIFLVRCRIWFDRNDFSNLKSSLAEEYRKIREKELYERLMKSLREKYRVRVNEQMLARADLYDMKAIHSTTPIVVSDRGNIALGQLAQKARGAQWFFRNYGQDPHKIEQPKKQTLDQLLSQALITWGALDRHYEKMTPLREGFQFYTNYRLVKELEQRMFTEGTEVSESEIADYYLRQKEDFMQPEKVHICILRYQGDHIDKLWAEIVTGADFFAIAEKYGVDRPMVQEEQPELLSQPLREKIKNLGRGEVAKPYYDRGEWVLIKLIDRREAAVEPMEMAAPKIAEKLQMTKFAQNRAALLAHLKANIPITVNEDIWLGLREEMAR
jgi:hypothetical protein